MFHSDETEERLRRVKSSTAPAPKNTNGVEPDGPRTTVQPPSSGPNPSGVGEAPSVAASALGSGGAGAVGMVFGVQSVAPLGDVLSAGQTAHSREPGVFA